MQKCCRNGSTPVPGHFLLSINELLNKMRTMFDKRENRLSLRREFENKTWQLDFSEYFHKKLILPNKVPIDEEKIIDYLIEKISVKAVTQQVMMQQFSSKEDMLKAMENVSLHQDQKIVLYKNKKQLSLKNGARPTKKIEGQPDIK